MAAAWGKIGESHFVHPAQIYLHRLRLHAQCGRVQCVPAQVVERHLGVQELAVGVDRPRTREQASVRQPHHRVQRVEISGSQDGTHARQAPQVHVAIAVPHRDGYRRAGQAGPEIGAAFVDVYGDVAGVGAIELRLE